MYNESGTERLDAIETMPLAERADAYLALHDELADRLESRAPRA